MSLLTWASRARFNTSSNRSTSLVSSSSRNVCSAFSCSRLAFPRSTHAGCTLRSRATVKASTSLATSVPRTACSKSIRISRRPRRSPARSSRSWPLAAPPASCVASSNAIRSVSTIPSLGSRSAKLESSGPCSAARATLPYSRSATSEARSNRNRATVCVRFSCPRLIMIGSTPTSSAKDNATTIACTSRPFKASSTARRASYCFSFAEASSKTSGSAPYFRASSNASLIEDRWLSSTSPFGPLGPMISM
mmetsp:Transcript_64400/g.172400  ORF Transcript_64400/g.172400 Transcript_64400/m.172400 type:complete len:250 (-) Transcript_64400:1154-1903(-)